MDVGAMGWGKGGKEGDGKKGDGKTAALAMAKARAPRSSRACKNGHVARESSKVTGGQSQKTVGAIEQSSAPHRLGQAWEESQC